MVADQQGSASLAAADIPVLRGALSWTRHPAPRVRLAAWTPTSVAPSVVDATREATVFVSEPSFLECCPS
jgi:hypothetical protein